MAGNLSNCWKLLGFALMKTSLLIDVGSFVEAWILSTVCLKIDVRICNNSANTARAGRIDFNVRIPATFTWWLKLSFALSLLLYLKKVNLVFGLKSSGNFLTVFTFENTIKLGKTEKIAPFSWHRLSTKSSSKIFGTLTDIFTLLIW